jgi:hypothetical protein
MEPEAGHWTADKLVESLHPLGRVWTKKTIRGHEVFGAWATFVPLGLFLGTSAPTGGNAFFRAGTTTEDGFRRGPC